MPSILDSIHLKAKVDNPTHVMDFDNSVIKVEFSPFGWSHSLICIAFSDKISVYVIKFQEEDDELEKEMECVPIQDFIIEYRVHALAWSPESSLHVLPKCVSLCSAGNDFMLRIFTSNTNDPYEEEVLAGHKSYINCVAYEPSGEYLASVSDDLTCMLWRAKEKRECLATYVLKSPGMSVCWHHEDPGKLLVGEKNGTVRFYNIEKHQAIQSFETMDVPLLSADWSPTNASLVAAIAAGKLVIWNTSRPIIPIENRPLHDKGCLIKFSRQSENHVAIVGQPGNVIKVVHTGIKQPVINSSLKCVGGLSWHRTLPYVAAGVDRALFLWKVSTN